MSIKPLLRLARATTVAALTVAASGPPVFGAVNEVALRLASVRCETERLRQKVAEAVYRGRILTVACQTGTRLGSPTMPSGEVAGPHCGCLIVMRGEPLPFTILVMASAGRGALQS